MTFSNTLPQFQRDFTVKLTGVSGASAVLGTDTGGTASILDDDPSP